MPPPPPAGTLSLHPAPDIAMCFTQTIFRCTKAPRKTFLQKMTTGRLHVRRATGARPRRGGRMPPTGCCASGENMKKDRMGKLAFPPVFSLFSLRLWAYFLSFSKQHAENRSNPPFPSSQGWVQGESPCRGVQGARSPLLRFSFGSASIQFHFRYPIFSSQGISRFFCMGIMSDCTKAMNSASVSQR